MKYYYVYRITDMKKEKYYIGSRTSTIKPEHDLGNIYFSSSSNRQFIKTQKEEPDRFIYEIIETFPSKEQAEKYEQYLIDQTNARNDPNYYNGRIISKIPLVSSRVTKDAVSYLGNLIKLARKEHRISQIELAERLNISRTTLRKIEAGNVGVAIGTVFEACFILRIPLFGCDEKYISNLSSMLMHMHRLLPERVQNNIVIDDDF